VSVIEAEGVRGSFTVTVTSTLSVSELEWLAVAVGVGVGGGVMVDVTEAVADDDVDASKVNDAEMENVSVATRVLECVGNSDDVAVGELVPLLAETDFSSLRDPEREDVVDTDDVAVNVIVDDGAPAVIDAVALRLSVRDGANFDSDVSVECDSLRICEKVTDSEYVSVSDAEGFPGDAEMVAVSVTLMVSVDETVKEANVFVVLLVGVMVTVDEMSTTEMVSDVVLLTWCDGLRPVWLRLADPLERDGVRVMILVLVTVADTERSWVAVGCEGDVLLVSEGLLVVDGVLRASVGELLRFSDGLSVTRCDDVIDGVEEHLVRLGVHGVTDTRKLKEGVTLLEPRDFDFVGPDGENDLVGLEVVSGDADVVTEGDDVCDGVADDSGVALVEGDRDDSRVIEELEV
jgi:hypothetical protein